MATLFFREARMSALGFTHPTALLRNQHIDRQLTGLRHIISSQQRQQLRSAPYSTINRVLNRPLASFNPSYCSCSALVLRRAFSVRAVVNDATNSTRSFIKNLTLRGIWQAFRRNFTIKNIRSVLGLETFTVENPTVWNKIKWYLKLQAKVLVLMYVVIWLFYWTIQGFFHLWHEYWWPTDPALEWQMRQALHFLRFRDTVRDDKPFAGRLGLQITQGLDSILQREGGWDNMSVEWKRACVDIWIWVAGLQQQLGFSERAMDFYLRILSTEPGVIDDTKRASNLLRLSDCYTTLQQHDKAFDCLYQAVALAANECGAIIDPRNPIFNPADPNLPSPQLISIVINLAGQYSRSPPKRPARSLPIFLSLIRVLQSLPEEQRDPCREALVMAFLGEVIYALGKKDEGYRWTLKGFEMSEEGAHRRTSCADCAHYAVQNAITMRKDIGIHNVEGEREIADLRRRERLLSRWDEKLIQDSI